MKKVFTLLLLVIANYVIAQDEPSNWFNNIFQQDVNKILEQKAELRRQDSIKYYKLDLKKLNQYVFDELNLVRVANKLPKVSLVTEDSLVTSCNEFAEYLVVNDLIGHGGGYYNGEICYAGFADLYNTLKNNVETDIYKKIASDMIAGWMSSPPHKTIILKNDYTKVIVSTAKDDLKQRNNLCGFDLRGVIRFYI